MPRASRGVSRPLGQPLEHVLRQCIIALRIDERLRLDEEERAVLYYTALLAYVGCHVDAHEQAKWLGDDLVAKGDARLSDLAAEVLGDEPCVTVDLGEEDADYANRT